MTSMKTLPVWLVLPAVLFSGATLRAEEKPLTKAELETTIRAYLLEHPEILIEMSQTLKTRQAAAQREQSQAAMTSKRAELVADATSPVAGKAKDGDGIVTIVEFFDYRCGYCKKVNPMVRKLVEEDPNIRVVFKEFPILGPESTTAALAALAAHDQGGYLEFHRALMSTGDMSMASLERVASGAGLDLERWKKDMAKPEHQATLARNQELGAALAIQATPAFVIGSEIVPGALDESTFRQLIAKARAETNPRAGFPLSSLH
jgi:protein-disulfide isomerase